MKQTWVTPRVNIQNFEANEYVAACWGVGCDWSTANDYEKKMGLISGRHGGNWNVAMPPIIVETAETR